MWYSIFQRIFPSDLIFGSTILDLLKLIICMLLFYESGVLSHFAVLASVLLSTFCICTVTLQAQREYPPDMQCKDKFLLQSTIVAPNTDVDDLPANTVRDSILSFTLYQLYKLKRKSWSWILLFGLQFNKDSGNSIEDLKLRVAYITPSSPEGSSEDDAAKNSGQKLDTSSVSVFSSSILCAIQFEVSFSLFISNLVSLCIWK